MAHGFLPSVLFNVSYKSCSMRVLEICQILFWPAISNHNHKWQRQNRPQREKKFANVTLQTWIATVTTFVAIALLTIQSRLYQDVHRVNQENVETIRQTRHEKMQQFNTTRIKNTPKKNMLSDRNTPVSRVGMVEKGFLRTMKVVTTDWDLILMEQTDSVKFRTKTNVNSPTTKTKIFPPPRVVILDMDFQTTPRSHQSPSRHVESMERENLSNDQEVDYYIRDFELPYLEQCEPILDPEVHPTCNSVHELTLEEDLISLLSTKGSWRMAWKVNFESHQDETSRNSTMPFLSNTTTPIATSHAMQNKPTLLTPVVLKMLHLHRDFDRQSYSAHETDIMVMDRLTASPYVVDAYGFCGQSVLTEFASSSGRDHVKRYDLRNKERLRIARDLAYGLADVQALRPLNHALPLDSQRTNSPPVFAHNDINIANTVMINGKLKWNDFNIGELLRRQRPNFDLSISLTVQVAESNHSTTKNSTTFSPFTVDNSSSRNDTICPVPVKYRSDLWRSPEEIRNHSYVRLDLSDMYGFGNILYQTMTRHQPWTHKEPNGKLEKEDVGGVKLQGAIPTVPEQYRNASQRELQIMFVATLSCYATDPNKRPTATRLARGLGILYDRLKNKTRISRADILDQILPYSIA